MTFILFIPIIYLSIKNGTLVNTTYLLATLLIILNSYIYEFGYQYIIYALFIFLGIINILQNSNMLRFEKIELNSDPISTFLSILLLFIIYKISKIGFTQIEFSINKAIVYSKELENLNKNLDKLVVKRTAQLNNSIQSQMETLHQVIIAGKVARPIFHDLYSPLTVIKGNTEILMNKLSSNEFQENLNSVMYAEMQIERIINSSKELMSSRAYYEEFNVKNIVDSVVLVLKSETNKKSIQIQNKINSKTTLYGIMSSFERIIINLLLNSYQSYTNCNYKINKVIKIKEKRDLKNIYIIIEDNGNGIESENISKVFDSGYTSNTLVENMGIGLDFVSSIIQNQYKGTVQIESKSKHYTKVILKIPIYKFDLTNPSSPNPSICYNPTYEHPN